MFVFSMRMTKKKAIFLVAMVAAILCSLIIFRSPDAAEQTLKNSIPSPKNIDSTSDMVEYLRGYGWEVSQDVLEFSEIQIPKEFGDVLNSYNVIQKESGFDLSKYKGKRLKRYTFEVLNYPEKAENVRANLLVHNNEIVGGDIASTESDGFIHGLINK